MSSSLSVVDLFRQQADGSSPGSVLHLPSTASIAPGVNALVVAYVCFWTLSPNKDGNNNTNLSLYPLTNSPFLISGTHSNINSPLPF